MKLLQDHQLFQFLSGLKRYLFFYKTNTLCFNMMNIGRRVPLIFPASQMTQLHSLLELVKGLIRDFSLKSSTLIQKKQFSSNVSCKYCKKPRHKIEKCYRLHDFPQDFKFTKNKSSASCVQGVEPPHQFGFTKEQYQHLLTLIEHTHHSSCCFHF